MTGPREYSTDEPIDGKDALPTVYLSEDEESQTLNKYHLVSIFRRFKSTPEKKESLILAGSISQSQRDRVHVCEGRCYGTILSFNYKVVFVVVD